MTLSETKTCAQCGRTITWRKKWEKNWDSIKFCSDRCRGDKSKWGGVNSGIFEQNILDLLNLRNQDKTSDKTICPSDILESDQKTNPELMESVRQAARRLAHSKKIEITQKGKAVDPTEFKGPIRLRLLR